jgi:hypothetical protein
MTHSEFIDLRIRHTDNLLAQRRLIKRRQALTAPLDAELDALLTEAEAIAAALEKGVQGPELKLVTS